MEDTVVSVSDFVALVNQTMEFAYPKISIEGEVSEFRVSKGKWVYFNLQDDHSSVRMFGSVYQLTHQIEDGMKVVVRGTPRLHNKYGFSLNIAHIQPSGEGSIKKAFELLKKKLEQEGLFALERKRRLPYAPSRIGLITSGQAAAYNDFMTILNQRWIGVEVLHADVQVQGEPAPGQIARAITYFSEMSEPVDVLVLTRGGGSTEDLMAFSTEEVARAVAGSRIPTIVGVGHEVDESLADLVADVRATTPTNAAQLVVPDRADVLAQIDNALHSITQSLTGGLRIRHARLTESLTDGVERVVSNMRGQLENTDRVLGLVNPHNILKRGYSLLQDATGKTIKQASSLKTGDHIVVRLHKGTVGAEVTDVSSK